MENKIVNNKTPNRTELPKGSNLLGSDYIVDKYFMSGGMKTDIYICHHKDDPDKKLAAKIVYRKTPEMTDEGWNRIQAEATNSLRVLNKPNLVQTYQVLSRKGDDPCICLIMDYVEGYSLREFLALNGCLIPKTALAIFLKILNGIKTLHNFKHQIIHRDLKPENIIISKDSSKVTIIDFGISTVIDTSETDGQDKKGKVLNDETNLWGTEQYIIPDIHQEYKKNEKDRNITVQADFYSLGVILYEMIIGQKPFDYTGINTKVGRIKVPLRFDMLNISANPSIPVALENIIFRCIACKPEDIHFRYNKIEEIIEDVKKCIPLLNKNDDNAKLLKPINKRMYQQAKLISIERIKSNQKWYKHWWFFAVAMGLAVSLLIACIIMFFIIV